MKINVRLLFTGKKDLEIAIKKYLEESIVNEFLEPGEKVEIKSIKIKK